MKSDGCSYCLPARQRGLALVLALMVMVMVAVAASYLYLDFERTARRTENRAVNSFNHHYSRGAEALARLALREDKEDNQVDHLGELWAQAKAFPIEEGVTAGGGISVKLEDLQGRLNINDLQAVVNNPDADRDFTHRFTEPQKYFIRLLQTFDDLPVNQVEAEEITEAVIDWLDTDDNPTGFGGAESLYYQSAGSENDIPGYRPANRPMVSVSELRLVKGITPELYRLLLPHVSVMPANVGINVNTATLNVLRSINLDSEGTPLAQADAEELVEERGTNGFEDMDSFNNASVIANLRTRGQLTGALLSVSSSYFMLHAETLIAERHGYTRSILHRDDNGVRVIARQLGRSPLIIPDDNE